VQYHPARIMPTCVPRCSSVDKLILLTTTRKRERRRELEALINSVEMSRAEMDGLEVHHYVLIQGVSGGSDAVSDAAMNSSAHLSYTPELVSLSRARNMMLTQIGEASGLCGAVIGFPDDDAWYPSGTLAGIMRCFLEDDLLDTWFCQCGTNRGPLSAFPGKPPRLQDLYSNATSNTIFVRGCLAKEIGAFDETLGLGTKAMSAEDSDFAVRAFRSGRGSRFVKAQMVGHRDHGDRDRELYFGGALTVIARYAPVLPGGYIALARKCLVGAALAITGRLRPQQLMSDFKRAFSVFNFRARS